MTKSQKFKEDICKTVGHNWSSTKCKRCGKINDGWLGSMWGTQILESKFVPADTIFVVDNKMIAPKIEFNKWKSETK